MLFCPCRPYNLIPRCALLLQPISQVPSAQPAHEAPVLAAHIALPTTAKQVSKVGVGHGCQGVEEGMGGTYMSPLRVNGERQPMHTACMQQRVTMSPGDVMAFVITNNFCCLRHSPDSITWVPVQWAHVIIWLCMAFLFMSIMPITLASIAHSKALTPRRCCAQPVLLAQ